MNDIFCKPLLAWMEQYNFIVIDPFTPQAFAAYQLVLHHAKPDQKNRIVEAWIAHGFLSWLDGGLLPTLEADLLSRSELLRALLLEPGIAFPLGSTSIQTMTTSLCFQKILQVPELTHDWVMSSDFIAADCQRETAEAVLAIMKGVWEVEDYGNPARYQADCNRPIIFDPENKPWVKTWSVQAWPLEEDLWSSKRTEVLQRIRGVLDKLRQSQDDSDASHDISV